MLLVSLPLLKEEQSEPVLEFRRNRLAVVELREQAEEVLQAILLQLLVLILINPLEH